MKNPLRFWSLAGALLWSTAPAGLAQIGVPVADINTQVAASNGFPDAMIKVTVGGSEVLYIATDDALNGAELWRSNGTPDGTVLVRDIYPGTTGSEPRYLTAVGERLYFAATSQDGSRDLWMTDGAAANTVRVADLAYPNGEGPEKLAAFQGQLYFDGFAAAAGRELWRSNGTVPGTVQVADINALGSASSGLSSLTVLNNTLFFTATNGTQSRELWKTDGTGPGTVLVKDIEPGGGAGFPAFLNAEFKVMNNRLFFPAYTGEKGTELWVSDGTEAGTALVRDIATETLSSTPAHLTVMSPQGETGPFLYFAAANDGDGIELWRSNGSAGNAEMLKNINAAGDSAPSQLTVVGSTLFFTADDGSGEELHSSNGRVGTNNTLRVADIVPGAGSSTPRNLTALVGTTSRLIFTAYDAAVDGVLGLYVSTTNASNLGNTPTRFKAFAAGDTASHFTQVGTGASARLYFLLNGSQLWRTDGTALGTELVRNFRSANASASPSSLAVANTQAFFAADDGVNGRELWITNGTSAGTSLVKDIAGGTAGSAPESLTFSGGKMFFSADPDGSNRELWMSNGSEAGTAVVTTQTGPNPEDVAEIHPGGASLPTDLTDLNGVLYFSATNSTSGREPWRTDGTPAGTWMIKASPSAEIAPGGSPSNPDQFLSYREDVLFVANTATGRNIVKVTPTGVDPIGYPAGVSGSTAPRGLVVLGTGSDARVYFAATVTSGIGGGRELWKTDGLTAERVKDINPGGDAFSRDLDTPNDLVVVGNTFYFAATNGTQGVELWKSRGTDATTLLVRDIAAGTAGSSPEDLTEAGGKLFFTADNGSNGRELWVSNGSSGGTFMVKDIVAGSGSPGIRDLRNIGGVLCFSADDGINGRELWISDGTAAGTVIINDLTGLQASSNAANFTPFQGQLLYTAADATYGDELRLAFIGADIQVEQPEGVELVSGLAEPGVDFGTLDFGQSSTLVFTVRNNGSGALTGVKPVISGVNAAEFTLVTPKAATTVGGGGTTTFGLKFTPKEGGVRQALLSIASNDGDTNPYLINLKGTGVKDPTITEHPVSLMLHVGEQAFFSATAESASLSPLSLQWKKGTSNLTGKTDDTLTIPAVILKDAGAYSLFAKGPTLSALSNPAQLGVVQPYAPPLALAVAAGKKAVLKVSAAGTGLSFLWKRNGAPLEGDTRVVGVNASTLSLSLLTTADTGLYTCEVTGPGGMRVGGNTQLNVFDAKPDVLDPQELPDGIVSGPYAHQIKVDPATHLAPSAYSAKGLPKGLSVNKTTGLISGKPLVAGDFLVTVTAANSFGSDVSLAETITIAPFPANLAGSYSGVVARNEDVNGDLGGRLDLVVGQTGAFSGSLTLGAARLPLKGSLDVDVDGIVHPSATLTLKRSGRPAPPDVVLEFNIDILGGVLAGSEARVGAEAAAIQGWRRLTVAEALPFAGYYTFGMELGDPGMVGQETIVPQGWSYGIFTVKNGALKIAGLTADGEKITMASAVGTGGHVPFFQTVYTPVRGSLRGFLRIDPVDDNNATDNTLTGDVDWLRPAVTSPKTRAYQNGFGLGGNPVPLEAVGSIHVPPPADHLILGLPTPPAAENVQLQFTFGGLADAAYDPDLVFGIAAGNKVVPANPPNEAGTKVNSLVAAKGTFNGGFQLVDADLRPGFTKPLTRPVKFQGVLIRDGADYLGAGFFMLPERPEGSQTPGNTAIFGGKVELLQNEN